MSEKWLKWYYISTYLLAIIAIIGFIFSVITSNETSKTLKSFEQTLENFTEVIIKLEEVNWLHHEIPPNCNYPPIGIRAFYKNDSNIPIKLINLDLTITMGELTVLKENLVDIGELTNQDSITVLSAGNSTYITIASPSAFKVFKNKHDIYNPPFLILKLTATVTTLNNQKKQQIEIIDAIGIECNAYSQSQIFNIEYNSHRLE